MKLEEFKKNIDIIIEDVREFAITCPYECIVLDTDISYLKSLDRLLNIIKKIYEEGKIENNQVNDISFNLGVFLGEMMLKENNYHWIMNNNLPMIESNKNNITNPISYIYHFITSKNTNIYLPSKYYNDFLKIDSE